MKKFFLILLFILFIEKINAECSSFDVLRQKSLVSNVNYSYDYYIVDNKAYFNVTLSNLTPEMYLIDSLNNKYSYYNSKNGELFLNSYSNNVEFTFYSTNCNNEKIGKIIINFPIYNEFYNDSICQGYNKFIWCKKWSNKVYSKQEIIELKEKQAKKQKILERNNETSSDRFYDKINTFYIKYYYVFLPIIIIIGIFSIIFVNKKQKFNLLD